MAKKSAKKPLQFTLDGELSIYRASELKATFLAQLQDTTELNVDLSGVTEIDTAGVQLLMMLKKEAAQLGKTVSLSNHSAAVISVFEAINVAG